MRSQISLTAVLFIICFAVLGADGCEETEGETQTDQEQREQTNQMVGQAHDKVGMPDITNFSERRLLKRIMELRDQEVGTHSYIVNMDGEAEKLCRSMGYGLPYGVQFVNPEKTVTEYDHKSVSVTTIPQPDPNGLFSPRNVDATWINCVTKSGDQKPVYSEEKVITSPVPLDQFQGNEIR